MAKFVLCLALICVTVVSIVHGFDAGYLCGDDWTPFEDEKCVKLFPIFSTYNDAERACSQENATLVTIRTATEQTFLRKLVSNATTHIWIGAQRRLDSEYEYKWNDGTAVDRFSYWLPGSPILNDMRACVMMRREGIPPSFRWSNFPCGTAAWFICQKKQTWPFEYLQEAILEARRSKEYSVLSFTDQLSDLTIKLNNSNSRIKYLEDNPVPIGFVYTQLPDQPEPWRIWWTGEWTEITEQYAGLFFRAEGGGSAEYGRIQEGHSPRLTRVQGRLVLSDAISSVTLPATGGISETVSAGATGATSHWGLRFTLSTGEVRPRNAAVRIWKRTN